MIRGGNPVKTLEDCMAAHYGALSEKLRLAADYVVAHPVEVATRSLRAVAEDSKLAPATFTRMAQALGFSGYEDLRELLRQAVGQRYDTFSEKAKALQDQVAGAEAPSFLTQHTEAVADNLALTMRDVTPERLEPLVHRLSMARTVFVIGGLSSHGLAQHIVYLARFFTARWQLLDPEGQSAAQALQGASEDDVLLVITLQPFAARTIRVAEAARARGVELIVLTDARACPALSHARHHLIVPTDSPQFFSSNAALLVLLEAIIGMLVGAADQSVQQRIAEVTDLNHRLGEYWAPS